MNKIAKKLGIVLACYLLLLVGIFGASYYIINKQESDGIFINMSGRQRMLSQKMSKEIFYYTLTEDHAIADQIKSTKKLFADSLNALSNGGKIQLDANGEKFTTIPPARGEALEQLKSVEKLWTEFSSNIDKVLMDRQDNVALKYIKDNNLTLLKEMDKAVYLLQVASESRVQILLQVQIISLILGVIISIISLFYFRKTIIFPIKEVKDRLTNIAQGGGDLTKKLPIVSDDEIGKLSKGFNSFLDNLNQILKLVKTNSEEIEDSIEKITQDSKIVQNNSIQNNESINSTDNRINNIANQISEINRTVWEIAQITSAVTEDAVALGERSEDVRKLAKEGTEDSQAIVNSMRKVLDNSVVSLQNMSRLMQLTDDIGNILQSVENITSSINLLALNAAIEAARAGEAGRGFSVVADEIRQLADESDQATEDIKNILLEVSAGIKSASQSSQEVNHAVEEANQKVDHTQSKINEIMENVNDITGRIQNIAASTEEQSASTEEVSAGFDQVTDELKQAVDNLDQVVNNINENSQNIDNQALQITEVYNKTENLIELVRKFRLSD